MSPPPWPECVRHRTTAALLPARSLVPARMPQYTRRKDDNAMLRLLTDLAMGESLAETYARWWDPTHRPPLWPAVSLQPRAPHCGRWYPLAAPVPATARWALVYIGAALWYPQYEGPPVSTDTPRCRI